MSDLLSRTNQSATVILCRRFRDCVMCVHEVQGKKQHAPTSYERGVAMSMFIGATSKVILAHLPDRTLKTTYLENEHVIRGALKIRSWKDFRGQLKAIRREGFALTDSEVAKGRIGLAAPIIRNGQAIASISLVVAGNKLGRQKIESLIPAVRAAANRISQTVSREKPIVTRR